MLALLLAAAVQAAPAPSVDADLRCLAVTTAALGSTKDEAVKPGLMAAAMYFVGRIDVVRPGYDYTKELGDLLTDDTRVKSLVADTARCAAIMKERGTVLLDVSRGLQARAKDAR